MPFNHLQEDETIKESLNLAIIKRLAGYLRPYRPQVALTLLLMGLVIGAELLNPYFLKLAIDQYIVKQDLAGLMLLASGMIGIKLAAVYCSRQRIRIMAGVTNRILLTIRQQLYAHIQKLPFSFFDNRPVGKILARIIGDVNSLSDLFSNSVTNLIPDLVTLAAVTLIMFAMNFRLALASLACLPLLFLFMCSIEVISHQRWRIHRKKVSTCNAFTHENFSGIRVVQSFTAEPETSRTYNRLIHENRRAFVRAVRLNDCFWPSVELSWGVGTMAVAWYGVHLLNTGTITVGLLVAFVGYISMFWQPVMNISNFYNTLVSNISGAERIFDILDIDPAIKDRPDARTLPPVRGEVVFEQVDFVYEADQNVLTQVNLRVQPGETIALVGPTGAGKTSIVNLICRFYEARNGRVLIDGRDVKQLTLESLRGQIGMVLQDTFLFSGSVKENIRYGRLDASDEEVIAAARAVHAHEFISQLEHGYDTDVNERGSRLSFGQRQQIAFARALLADPRILILDEATAGIDTHTERLVQQGIAKLLKGRTSFVIAHRLSTIQNADRILVIDRGRIVESGTHAELLQERGLYYQLFMAQFKFLQEEPAEAAG
ncbi:ATP-binding cassette subfamily B protein [Hydrogenispora ethanolica]|uniref:ATP-binding cassette subfamily B protein n=1 Tax=Hydrogenispora ethanolica TaxID=1082276 RepID=A0A4R1QZA3_HYDET|nr:ABC transporter ATP-binding protein [Hydrogenispora ethanolica]TCL58322.1 ATP-binding cassette subfamily B protein [Hydrogenispora ethanolica]